VGLTKWPRRSGLNGLMVFDDLVPALVLVFLHVDGPTRIQLLAWGREMGRYWHLCLIWFLWVAVCGTWLACAG
jgi:hypothetical protein